MHAQPMPPRMQAVAWIAPNELALQSVPTPVIESPTDAIVQVSHASTCGTDLHCFRGAVPGFEPGTIIGHEFVGRVVAVGTEVRHALGARVRCSDFVACGLCEACASGAHSQCPHRRLFGFSGVQRRLDGGLAEYVRVPWADTVLMPMDEGVDPRAGLLMADVLPTAHGALERAHLRPGERVAIVGSGAVGLLTALLAVLRSASVTVLDVDASRCAVARLAGLRAEQVEPDASRGCVGSGGYDVVVDAVGGETGLSAALALVRGGGRVVGVGSQSRAFAVDWAQVFQREISLHFVIGNPLDRGAALARAMRECVPLLDLIFRDAINLNEVPAYFRGLLDRSRFKAVVTVADSIAGGVRPSSLCERTVEETAS